jgi:hypothetical protein
MRRPVYAVAGALALALVFTLGAPRAIHAQRARWVPPDPVNLKVLPKNISKDDLVRTMRGFTAGLGVRCAFCHKGEEGQPLDTYDFMSDAKPQKETARKMLTMVAAINRDYLKGVTVERDETAEAEGKEVAEGHEAGEKAEAPEQARVTCYTCHRGQAHPVMMPPPREGRGRP